MTTVRDLHDQAMALAQDALVARERGNLILAADLARQALPLELAAAAHIEKAPASEPTRSILYLGAASLAYQAGDFSASQRLIGEALSGWPSPKTEHDLLVLLARICGEHWQAFYEEAMEG